MHCSCWCSPHIVRPRNQRNVFIRPLLPNFRGCCWYGQSAATRKGFTRRLVFSQEQIRHSCFSFSAASGHSGGKSARVLLWQKENNLSACVLFLYAIPLVEWYFQSNRLLWIEPLDMCPGKKGRFILGQHLYYETLRVRNILGAF